MLTMIITFRVQTFEEFVGQYAGLGLTIHAHFDFHIDPSLLVDDVTEVVFCDYFVGDEF